MKKTILMAAALLVAAVTQAQVKTAMLVIDIQNFYFPGGKSELVNPSAASEKAALAITHARSRGIPVIYVQHRSPQGMEINESVRPDANDKIFVKEEVNSFRGTGLDEYLRGTGIDTLVICGMQTHMCVEAAVLAGHDLGYKVILLHDACATRNLKYGEREVIAADVHASTLATLKSYCEVISAEEWQRR